MTQIDIASKNMYVVIGPVGIANSLSWRGFLRFSYHGRACTNRAFKLVLFANRRKLQAAMTCKFVWLRCGVLVAVTGDLAAIVFPTNKQ